MRRLNNRSKNTGNLHQVEAKTLHARQVGICHHDVREGLPVLCRHPEGDKGKCWTPEVLLVLKKGGDVSAFHKALDRVVGKRANISKSQRGPFKLGILKKPKRKKRSWLFPWLGGVKNAVIQMTVAEASPLLQLENIRIGWVEGSIREHAVARYFRCLRYGHKSRGCGNFDIKDASRRCSTAWHMTKNCKAPPRYLTCSNRVEKGVAHVSSSGSCPVCREELRRSRGGKWSSCNSTSQLCFKSMSNKEVRLLFKPYNGSF